MPNGTADPAPDLNDVIASAVNARVEAAVAQALHGTEIFDEWVTAALQAPVEVPDPNRSYGTVKTSFLKHAISIAMRDAAKKAVEAYLATEAGQLEDLVAKQIRKAAPTIAQQMVGQVVEKAAGTYGIEVKIKYPERY